MRSAADVLHFYREPVHNVTKYAEMARSASKPENLAVLEHAVRFHPNDREAPHGGGFLRWPTLNDEGLGPRIESTLLFQGSRRTRAQEDKCSVCGRRDCS